MNENLQFSLVVIVIVAILQIVAWVMGFNGQVFAFTSLVIGAIVGAALGFTINLRGAAKEIIDQEQEIIKQELKK